MRLTNVRLPADLEQELENTSARLGVDKSEVHRAALRSFLAGSPTADEVKELDGLTMGAVRLGRARRDAAALLSKAGL
jgi:hypothetical protein